MMLEQVTINMPSTIEHQSLIVKYIKIKFKCIIDLNVKYIITKLLEENLRNIWLGIKPIVCDKYMKRCPTYSLKKCHIETIDFTAHLWEWLK